MRRPGLRPLGTALGDVLSSATPSTPLAAIQQAWEPAVGPTVAAEAAPVSERAGVVTVECSSALWAHELELLSSDLLGRLGERLAGAAEVRELRFVAGGTRPARRRPGRFS